MAAMTEAIETATRFVHVQFYISAWDHVTEPFFAALVRATERGVKVRILFDHLGSRGIPTYKETLRTRKTEIEWHPMLPIAPVQRQDTTARPAQPPQDPRRGLGRRLCRLPRT